MVHSATCLLYTSICCIGRLARPGREPQSERSPGLCADLCSYRHCTGASKEKLLVLLLIGQIEGIKSLASGFAEFFYAVVRMLKLCVGIESAFVSRDGEQVVQADGDAAGTQSPEAGENQDDAGLHFSPIYVHPLQILKEMFPGGVPIIVERRTRAGMRCV